MKNFFRVLAVAALFAALSSTASAQVSQTIQIGPPPRVQRVAAMPGPDFVWVGQSARPSAPCSTSLLCD